MVMKALNLLVDRSQMVLLQYTGLKRFKPALPDGNESIESFDRSFISKVER